MDTIDIFELARQAVRSQDDRGFVEHLARVIREGPTSGCDERVRELTTLLEGDPDTAHLGGRAVERLLVRLRVGPALVSSGVSSSSGFLSEISSRLVRRFLPDLEETNDLRTLIRKAFDSRDIRARLNAVSDGSWFRLLDVLGVAKEPPSGVDSELAGAIRALAHHAGSLGLDSEFVSRLPYLEQPESPFLELTDRVLAYIRSYTNSVEGDEPELLAEALATVTRCRKEVEHIRATKEVRGTSLELTGKTFRLLQLLERLELLLSLSSRTADNFQSCAITLFKQIVVAEGSRNHVTPVLRDRADLLAFRVVENAARKGEKYITRTKHEYFRFFLASAGGGAIVAVFSFLKVVLGSNTYPLAVQAIVYGLNYSVCFLVIYFTGAALATKQPALTANTIAQALGNRDARDLDSLESLVVRVWRSQFVSFVGNLALALPMAFLVSELFFQAAGRTVAAPEKAMSMLEALHPWRSGTLPFAAIAGLFLFMAGLVSGWVDNRTVFSQLRERVSQHPLIVRIVGARGASRFGDLVHRHLGVATGNVFLGFALGSTGTIGEILGLPLDIRHIAFASAEFGTSLEILHLRVALSLVAQVALGVFAIGLINFLVSFGLSLATALESRNITWSETRVLAVHLVRRFMKKPLEWFLPVSNQ